MLENGCWRVLVGQWCRLADPSVGECGGGPGGCHDGDELIGFVGVAVIEELLDGCSAARDVPGAVLFLGFE